MSESRSPTRKRLLYRASYRGFKEADLLIGQFAAANLATMTDEEEQEFTRLLDVPDHDLYGWIIRRDPVPANFEGPVMTKLQDFNIAAIVAPR
ncbi:succinate dehydrogenase assembly factor 2 [Parvularcula sp. LCG005]|uniref:succinate dehydrogenase assembly factor 2 n=1 Tax=Parvularcula sp. LCG005 TaxID=3078805 RepID=UPI0029428BAC|nr:succinate dehydrogenase assembly factor 2 [Parvularcula sp. LCG005]WOI52250.1 succinate dehydrogenase assembly factor 2 [Parvularcula sp. LCG005]